MVKNMVSTKDMSVVKEYVPVKNDIFLQGKIPSG